MQDLNNFFSCFTVIILCLTVWRFFSSFLLLFSTFDYDVRAFSATNHIYCTSVMSCNVWLLSGYSLFLFFLVFVGFFYHTHYLAYFEAYKLLICLHLLEFYCPPSLFSLPLHFISSTNVIHLLHLLSSRSLVYKVKKMDPYTNPCDSVSVTSLHVKLLAYIVTALKKNTFELLHSLLKLDILGKLRLQIWKNRIRKKGVYLEVIVFSP